MTDLPYVDEHAIVIPAGRERTWAALVTVLRSLLSGRPPQPIVDAMRIDPSRRAGDWTGDIAPGATLPGFAVAEVTRASRLALRGSHRFSRYALVFELDDAGPGEVRLRAQTWAEFPGARGRVYRALVIGSGGHRIGVRRLLRQVAQKV